MTPCVVLPETGESNQIDFQVINDVIICFHHIGYLPIMASLSRALQVDSLCECVANSLGYCSLKLEQKAIITNFIMGKDVLLYFQRAMGKICAMHVYLACLTSYLAVHFRLLLQ